MKIFIYDNGYNLTNYVNAVKKCNCTPILTKNLIEHQFCDALLLTGGGDIHPSFYGEPPLDYIYYNTQTDISEMYLLNAFLKKNKQIIGVCKGMQVINVYFGGTLEYIYDPQLNNHYALNKDVKHIVFDNLKNKKIVNSSHKQRIKNLGYGLNIEERSKDGTIEAISHKKYKVYGVQYHPERLSEYEMLSFYKKFFN